VIAEAGIALSSELSLDALLQRLVNTVAELTGARYAALGVIDRAGVALERFLTSGIDEHMRAEIGDLPHGRGILGVLIHDSRTLRLSDLSADPRSVGFPPGHPPMRSFLGVPITLRGIPYGNLYLTEKQGGGQFTDEDEELTTLLAAQAAVAIENARLYESSTRWLRQLESLNEIGNLMSAELELPRLLELIATRVLELIDARIVTIWVPDANGTLKLEAAAGDWPAAAVSIDGTADPKVARVLERGHSARVDSLLEDPESDQEAARRLGLKSGLWVPLLGRGGAVGIVAAYDKRAHDPRFSDGDLRLVEALASRAAIAVELSQQVASDLVRRVLEAQEGERRQLARELHDETGQALTSTLLGLQAVEAASGDEDALLAATANLRVLLVSALDNVRRLAFQLRPQVLDDFGLVVAVERLTERLTEYSGLAINFAASIDFRLPGEVETCLYRIVQEALTNIVKHAEASTVSIVITRTDGGEIAVLVEDDGRGFSQASVSEESFGLVAMRERLAHLGGTLEIDSGPDRGTQLRARLPALERAP